MKYYKDASNNVYFADRESHETLVPSGCTEITEAEAYILIAPKRLKESAQADLDKSDITIARCTENAVAVPAAWHTYREDLRAIVRGTSTATELPTKPDYPAGT